MKLSKAEEQVMHIIWNKKKSFLKDLIKEYPDPQPAGSTLATLLKRIHKKEILDYTLIGGAREYFPLVKKNDYLSLQVEELVKDSFNGSPTNFASFFLQNSARIEQHF